VQLAEIVLQLNDLNKQSSQLDLQQNERLSIQQTVVDFANNFINHLPNVKGFIEKKPQGLDINNSPKPLKEILQLYQTEVAENGINAASGTHMGYIPGGGVFTAALADYIAAITNPFASVYYASPGAATIENEVISWLKKVFNFPTTAVGNLTSGGSVSTLIAFTAARDKHKIKNELIKKSVVYLSEQVHHSTQKALRIIGLEDVIIRYVPLNEHHRIKTEALEKLIEQDIANQLNPFLIVATAGTTDTGAIDPLNEISLIAKKHQIWFHVDAAYGGFFILSSKKTMFQGIEDADSIIIDPHKSLFLPYGLGAVLIKHKEAVLHANNYTANYMQDAVIDELVQNPSNVSPELTKHFRGLRMWLPLQYHGVKPFIACLEEKLLLVQYFRLKITALGFCVGPEPDLSISYFWYPFSTQCNEKNKQLMQAIHQDGSVFLSSSIINNQFVIRIAILAFRTKKETVDKAIAMIERCLQTINK